MIQILLFQLFTLTWRLLGKHAMVISVMNSYHTILMQNEYICCPSS
uniref:Uncharacterized protein n=1 Tax=Arundo donax TaxID=35708 RepID=A0A0A9C2G1_ARUDO